MRVSVMSPRSEDWLQLLGVQLKQDRFDERSSILLVLLMVKPFSLSTRRTWPATENLSIKFDLERIEAPFLFNIEKLKIPSIADIRIFSLLFLLQVWLEFQSFSSSEISCCKHLIPESFSQRSKGHRMEKVTGSPTHEPASLRKWRK